MPAEDQDPLFLDQARQIGDQSERDRLRTVLDFDLAAGQEAVSIPQLLWNNDPSETIHHCFHWHTLLPWFNAKWHLSMAKRSKGSACALRQNGKVFAPILLASGRG